jgi:hypothetical protein
MTDVKELMETVQVYCECPFKDSESKSMPLKEMLKISGYLNTVSEIRNIDKAIARKKNSDDVTEEERLLLEQIHAEVLNLYSEAAVVVDKAQPEASVSGNIEVGEESI